MATVQRIMTAAEQWLVGCLRIDQVHPRWPLTPFLSTCQRTPSQLRSVPALLSKESVVGAANHWRPMSKASNHRLLTMALGDHDLRLFGGGDLVTANFCFILRQEDPALQFMIPMVGPLHVHMNLCSGIMNTCGEFLLWPCAVFLQRRGLKHVAKSFQQLEELIVVVTAAAVRALRMMGVPVTVLSHAGFQRVFVHGFYSPRIQALIWFVGRIGMMYCYTRTVGRVGKSMEWLAAFQTWASFLKLARMHNYSKLLQKWMVLLFFPAAGVTPTQQESLMELLLLRHTPSNAMCIGFDDVSEQVFIFF